MKAYGLIQSRMLIVTATAVLMACVLALAPCPSFGAEAQVTDMSISDAVQDEMQIEGAVPAHLIDVVTVDGIVTLIGTVDNLIAKERAARIAQIVKGVRAVINNIEVDPILLPKDMNIREAVEEALLLDPAVESTEVTVRAEGSRVSLSGNVDSWQEKVLCGKVAKGVKGVTALENNLRVEWTKERSDPEIMAEVKKALEWNALVDHALIDVEVREGEVILSGIVGSAAEKSEAYMDALVSGVKSVNASQLKVRKWARDKDLRDSKYIARSAEQIESAIKDALLYDPRVSSFKITPDVVDDGSRIILRGTVDNLRAKRAAAQDARNTVGVWKVENRIKVRPAGRQNENEIEATIRRALRIDPYVDKYQITVSLRHGVASLSGTVDSYFEKVRADNVVSKVKGVLVVNNFLEVRKFGAPYTLDPYVDGWSLEDPYWRPDKPVLAVKSDSQIRDDIERQLFWSPFVDSDSVTVTVEDGEATLRGAVDSYMEYGAARDNAYQGGAISVVNNIVVR